MLVGNVRVPQISGKVEKTASGARIVLSVQPATPHRVTRDGNKLTVRFDAAALDMRRSRASSRSSRQPRRSTARRSSSTSDTSAATFKVEDDAGRGCTIELLPPAPVAPPPPPPRCRPRRRRARPGRYRNRRASKSVPAASARSCIDPGHGGDDAGVKGAGGTKEKDLTLQVARRLKRAIEARLGHARAADARRRRRRARRSPHGVREQQQGRSVPEPARELVRAAGRARARRCTRSTWRTIRSRPATGSRRQARTVPVLGGGTRVTRSGALGSGAVALRRASPRRWPRSWSSSSASAACRCTAGRR